MDQWKVPEPSTMSWGDIADEYDEDAIYYKHLFEDPEGTQPPSQPLDYNVLTEENTGIGVQTDEEKVEELSELIEKEVIEWLIQEEHEGIVSRVIREIQAIMLEETSSCVANQQQVEAIGTSGQNEVLVESIQEMKDEWAIFDKKASKREYDIFVNTDFVTLSSFRVLIDKPHSSTIQVMNYRKAAIIGAYGEEIDGIKNDEYRCVILYKTLKAVADAWIPSVAKEAAARHMLVQLSTTEPDIEVKSADINLFFDHYALFGSLQHLKRNAKLEYSVCKLDSEYLCKMRFGAIEKSHTHNVRFFAIMECAKKIHKSVNGFDFERCFFIVGDLCDPLKKYCLYEEIHY